MTDFLVDQQLPLALATHLASLGHGAKHIKEYPGGETLHDPEVTRIADVENRVLITKDEDFRISHLLHQRPARLIHVTCGTFRPANYSHWSIGTIPRWSRRLTRSSTSNSASLA